MQGWPCRVGGNGISAWQGGGEQGEEHWGELELKLEKQKSQLMERCEFQVKDFRLYHVEYS